MYFSWLVAACYEIAGMEGGGGVALDTPPIEPHWKFYNRGGKSFLCQVGWGNWGPQPTCRSVKLPAQSFVFKTFQ